MNDREELILKALLRCLKESGDYFTRSSHLLAEVGQKVPRLLATEFDDILADAEGKRLVTAVQGHRGPEYKINKNGLGWLSDANL